MGEYKPTAAQVKLRKLIRDHIHVMAFGGSRSGKTFEFCRALHVCAMRYPGSRSAIMRKHFNAVKMAVFNDTFPSMVRLCTPGANIKRNESETFIKYPSGSEVWFLGLDDKDRVDKILGREFSIIYFNECSEISFHAVETAMTRLSQKAYTEDGKRLQNRAFYDCNPPHKTHWAHRWFVEKVHPVSRIPLKNADDIASIQINPHDNEGNLPPGYIENILENMSEAKQARFLRGIWLDSNENALWKQESMIDAYRVNTFPNDLERIVIGVDPAVTSNNASDMTGIVVAGKRQGMDGRVHYYVLNDSSINAQPLQWATVVNSLYHQYKADMVVAEVNNGGDLVETVLRQVNPDLPISKVHASRGKIVRAEPIATLYGQGRVHHVEDMVALEEELTSYTGDASDSSPDRMDAMVWALWSLSEGENGMEFDSMGAMI